MESRVGWCVLYGAERREGLEFQSVAFLDDGENPLIGGDLFPKWKERGESFVKIGAGVVSVKDAGEKALPIS